MKGVLISQTFIPISLKLLDLDNILDFENSLINKKSS